MLVDFRQSDKQVHFLISFLITISSLHIVTHYLSYNKLFLLYVFLFTFSIGLGKEIYDYYHRDKHTPDIKDLIADTLGNIFGIIIFLI